jgi:hypothetical protein
MMSKRRKIWICVGTMLFAFFVGWPTVHALFIRGRASSALKQAESVRLEEFVFHVPLASVELPRPQWSEITAHLPMVPDVGVPGSVKLCFIPHHRIVITGPHQQQFIFTVCFGCDQATVGNSGIFALPYLWSTPLRHLFMSHQIRIRSDREYTEAAFEHSHPL